MLLGTAGCGEDGPAEPRVAPVSGSIAVRWSNLQYLLFPGDEIVDSLLVEVESTGPVELEVQRQVVPPWLGLELVEHGPATFLRYRIRGGAGASPAQVARFRVAARGETGVDPAEIYIDRLVEAPPDAVAAWTPFCIDGPAVRDDPELPRACVELTLYQWFSPGGSRVLYDIRNLQGSLGGEWDTATSFTFFVVLALPGDGIPEVPRVVYSRLQGKVGQEHGELAWHAESRDPRSLVLDGPYADQILGCGPSRWDHIDRARVSTCRPRGETGSVLVALDAPGLTESVTGVSAGLAAHLEGKDPYSGLGVTCVPWPRADICPPPS